MEIKMTCPNCQSQDFVVETEWKPREYRPRLFRECRLVCRQCKIYYEIEMLPVRKGLVEIEKLGYDVATDQGTKCPECGSKNLKQTEYNHGKAFEVRCQQCMFLVKEVANP
jgi:transposase-like protein